MVGGFFNAKAQRGKGTQRVFSQFWPAAADKQITYTLFPIYLLPANGKLMTAENYQEDQGCQGCQICEYYGLALLVFAKYFGGGVKIYGGVGGERVIDFGKWV
jgi:hypothetical protein